MKKLLHGREVHTETRLSLQAQTAEDLMTRNPVSIQASATPQEAAEFFYKHGFSAAPVIDEAGRALGVLSLSDLAWFQRAKDGHFQDATPEVKPKVSTSRTVREIMTPADFSVRPETPIRQVLEEMCASKIHRLFVVDGEGTLIGVIAAFDVMRDLIQVPQ